MKLIVDRGLLSSSVNFVTRMIPARPPSPILSGMLIEAKNEKVTLSTFNYETSAKVEFSANVIEGGKVLVPGTLISSISQKLPDEPVEISKEDEKISLTCGPVNYILNLMPIAEYPPLPNLENAEQYRIPSEDFVKSVSQVTTSAAKDDISAVITGINLRLSNESIELTGTDRYRVAVKTLNSVSGHPSDSSVIVSSKTLFEVSKTLGNLESEISVFIKNDGENKVIGFESGNKTVTSLLISGNYPPVAKLFTEETGHYAILKTSDFLESTKRVSVVVERDEPIEFSFVKNTVTIKGSGIALASEKVECELFGDEISIMLRPQFLCDGLIACQEDFIKVAFTKPSVKNRPGPVLITPKLSNKEKIDFKYLLQPNLFAK
ncbi:DNA polymerase III subunit beta [Tropheryma whipplei]|uniref:Beta sliding clamp n=1 Tax=Tropheryma whipplei (strain Twist) TaxID=203267 RepID=Q83H56_TROWT|nr:DNA polymerase III subunit beta [Tropheryma whipplei]AAO44099.1 DNA polymerase III beta chain [Tropheryma whipplei str. Twist]MCO8182812.1 DNA polymerase III subunit beta [Tropheryma whipplei]MCO8190510.1 DNA polymerase III subunit beta [Tropheryma whipplei]CAD66694.1 DNA polymerase III, beta chain [Tropheryma whipplei TW08/27]